MSRTTLLTRGNHVAQIRYRLAALGRTLHGGYVIAAVITACSRSDSELNLVVALFTTARVPSVPKIQVQILFSETLAFFFLCKERTEKGQNYEVHG